MAVAEEMPVEAEMASPRPDIVRAELEAPVAEVERRMETSASLAISTVLFRNCSVNSSSIPAMRVARTVDEMVTCLSINCV